MVNLLVGRMVRPPLHSESKMPDSLARDQLIKLCATKALAMVGAIAPPTDLYAIGRAYRITIVQGVHNGRSMEPSSTALNRSVERSRRMRGIGQDLNVAAKSRTARVLPRPPLAQECWQAP